MERRLSRREFIECGSLAGSALLLSGCMRRPHIPVPSVTPTEPLSQPTPKSSDQVATPPETPFPTPIQEKGLTYARKDIEQMEMTLGKEKLIPLDKLGITYAPDGHFSYVSFPDGTQRYFLSGFYQGRQGTITFTNRNIQLFDELYNGSDPATLLNDIIFIPGQRGENSTPEENYMNGYSAITSVIQDPHDPYHLLASTHNEEWPLPKNGERFNGDSSYRATIGLLESHNGGVRWKNHGVIIRGQHELDPDQGASGAGQACMLLDEKEDQKLLKIYHTQWNGSAQIYLSALELNDDGSLNKKPDGTIKVLYWASGETLTPVIPVPEGIPGSKYAALPAVARIANKKVAGVESDKGFCISYSDDNKEIWSPPKLVYPYAIDKSKIEVGDVWRGYWTPVSLKEPSGLILTQTGFLVHSLGELGKPHQLALTPYEIK